MEIVNLPLDVLVVICEKLSVKDAWNFGQLANVLKLFAMTWFGCVAVLRLCR